MLFDDSLVRFKAHEVLNNTNVVLVVMRRVGLSVSATDLSNRISASSIASKNAIAIGNGQNSEIQSQRRKQKTNLEFCLNPTRRKLNSESQRLQMAASAVRQKISKATSISHPSNHGTKSSNSDDSYDPGKDRLRKRNSSRKRARKKWLKKRKIAGTAATAIQVAVKRKRRKKGDIDRSAEVQRKASRRKAGDIDRSGEVKRKASRRKAGDIDRSC